jgi:hypothetical protein
MRNGTAEHGFGRSIAQNLTKELRFISNLDVAVLNCSRILDHPDVGALPGI